MTIRKVLHITPSVRLLGARRSLLTLVRELAGTRYEPVVLAPAAGALTEELDKRRLPWRELRLPPWRKAASWLTIPGRVRALREIIRDEKIDLVHCNEIYPNPHALVAASAGPAMRELASAALLHRPTYPLGVPVVTHMRLSVTPRLVRNYLLEHATRIICVSHGAARDFDGFTWRDRKVRVVYNGVDFGEFEAARGRREAVRERLGYGPGDFVIGHVGLMMPRKRPRFLIETAPELLRLLPQARFLFVGEASPGQAHHLDELKARARELGVDHAVRFLPFQQQVADIFAALDLNTLLSNDEGFGRVVIEAAACRVPTVGSHVGGIPELIVDGETGYILGPPDCPDAEFSQLTTGFAHLVLGLARREPVREEMGRRAYERARKLFSMEQHARSVVEVFDEAVEEQRLNQPPW